MGSVATHSWEMAETKQLFNLICYTASICVAAKKHSAMALEQQLLRHWQMILSIIISFQGVLRGQGIIPSMPKCFPNPYRSPITETSFWSTSHRQELRVKGASKVLSLSLISGQWRLMIYIQMCKRSMQKHWPKHIQKPLITERIILQWPKDQVLVIRCETEYRKTNVVIAMHHYLKTKLEKRPSWSASRQTALLATKSPALQHSELEPPLSQLSRGVIHIIATWDDSKWGET